jgi:hypothetical protein
MKPITKEEKSLKEGFEKASWNQDNMNWKCCLAFWNRIGRSPFWAKLKPGGFISLLWETAFPFSSLKSARLQ